MWGCFDNCVSVLVICVSYKFMLVRVIGGSGGGRRKMACDST